MVGYVFTQQWEGKDKKKNLFILVEASVASVPVRVKRLPNSGLGKISSRGVAKSLAYGCLKHDFMVR